MTNQTKATKITSWAMKMATQKISATAHHRAPEPPIRQPYLLLNWGRKASPPSGTGKHLPKRLMTLETLWNGLWKVLACNFTGPWSTCTTVIWRCSSTALPNCTPGKKFWVRTFHFLPMRRKYLYFHRSVVAANFGGLVGLCSGFSFLSVVEIVYFFTLRLYLQLFRKRHPREQLDATDDVLGIGDWGENWSGNHNRNTFRGSSWLSSD